MVLDGGPGLGRGVIGVHHLTMLF